MATSFYNEARVAAASKGIDWVVDPMEVLFVGTGYTFDPTDTSADIPPTEILGTGDILNPVLDSAGWLVADDTEVPMAGSFKTIVAMIVRGKPDGLLLLFSDVPEGLPFVDTGGTWLVRMDNVLKAFGKF